MNLLESHQIYHETPLLRAIEIEWVFIVLVFAKQKRKNKQMKQTVTDWETVAPHWKAESGLRDSNSEAAWMTTKQKTAVTYLNV